MYYTLLYSLYTMFRSEYHACCDDSPMFLCVHFQHMEDLWRDARWMVVLQSARYKHQSSGVSLSWIIDFSKESIPEKPASTSSQVDYLPSPTPSPETTRKHNGESVHLSVLHYIIKYCTYHRITGLLQASCHQVIK